MVTKTQGRSDSNMIFDTILEQPNSENCLDEVSGAHSCQKIIFVSAKYISHLQSENSYWTCQVLAASKMKTFKSDPNED